MRRRSAALLVACTALLLAPAAPAATGSEQSGPQQGEPPLPAGVGQEAPRVAAIEIHSDTTLSTENLAEVRQLLALEPGARLTEKRIARALRNLQASGIASRVDLYTRPAAGEAGRAGQVVAEVVLRANLLVEAVRIEGDHGEVSRGDLSAALFQKAGEPLIESRLVRGVYEMQEIFRREGYFEAGVRLAPQIDEARRRATVVYRVDAGPRATVARIAYDGDRGPFQPADLGEPLRTKVGEPFRLGVAERDAERLQAWLIGHKYRTARVDEPRVDYQPESRQVAVTFPLTVGPEVRVEVRGADRKKLQKRDLIPFLGDEGYDEALLLLAEKRLRNYYQEQGHHEVRVDAREEPADGVLNVVVDIEPGPVFTLKELRFSGNEAVSDDRLRELVATEETGLLTRLPGIGGGHLVDEVLAADVDNVRAYYALQGFVDAEVGPPRVEAIGDHDLRVTIPIEEGRQQKVVGLSLSGVEAFDPEALKRDLPLEEGGPFHPRILDLSLNEIRSRYERDGYDAVNVSATTAWNPEHSLAEVAIHVLEGPQTVVDRIIVRGNQHTAAQVIRRAVGLERGEAVSRSRLLEAERNLYRLGIFSRAELELTPAPLGATTRDVVVRVEEGRVRSLRYGVSVEYNDQTTDFSYGGSVGFSHSNLFGRAITLSADARVLSKEEQYRLFVEQPTIGDLDVPVTYSLFRTEEQRTSFRVARRGVRIEARRQLGDRTRLGLAYDYRIVENSPLGFMPLSGDNGDLTRTDQTLRVASLIPTLILDHRNDPLYPTRGWNSLLQVQYAFPLLAAEADYLKLFVQHSQYLHLGFATLALSGRLGGIEPLSGLPGDIQDPFIPPGAGLPSQDIFLAERFFAGGGSSHRGYGPDELGIPYSTCLDAAGAVAADCSATLFPDAGGTLRPAGGNGLAIANVDLRFPLFGAVEGVLFFDTGNVWADWRGIDLADFRSGSGIEVRYVTPVGPLRLGVGFPLDPIPGADDYVVFVNLGSPF